MFVYSREIQFRMFSILHTQLPVGYYYYSLTPMNFNWNSIEFKIIFQFKFNGVCFYLCVSPDTLLNDLQSCN